MWLPSPVYESLPYMYVAVGILLIAGGGYIGIDSRETALYIGSGSVAVLCGVLVYVRRSVSRAQRNQQSSDSDAPSHE